MPVNLGGGAAPATMPAPASSTPSPSSSPPSSSAPSGSQSIGSIFLNLLINNNTTDQIRRQSNQAASFASSAFNRIGSMAGTVLKTVSIAAMVKFGKECVDVASDIQEVQNVVDTAFGDMANQCEEFAKKAADQFGLSELSAKKMASTFMSMSKGMGLNDEDASQMSINVAKLSADVASFYNLTADLASTKLKAIWTGETEGLKDLGVVMTQTNLSNYALSKGITKNIQDMTQAEQTTLRYHYVMEQLGLAQGDFAKTSNSWSNSLKAMGENLKTVMANIGTILIDVLTPAVQVLADLVDKLKEVTKTAQELYGKYLSKFFGKGLTEQAVKETEETGKAMTETVEKTATEIEKAALGLAGFDDLFTIGKSEKSSDSSGNAVADALGEIGAYNGGEEDNEGKKELTVIDKFIARIKDFYSQIKPYVDSVYNTFIKPLVDAGVYAFEYIQTKVEPMKEVFASVFGSIKEIGKNAFDLLANIFGDIDFKAIIQGIIDAVVNFYQVVDKFIKQMVVPIFKILFGYIQTWWNEHGQALFSNLFIMLQQLANFLKPFIDWLIDNVGPFIIHCFDNLMAGFSWIVGALSDVLNFIITFCASVFNAWSEVFDVGLVQMIENFFAWLAGIFASLWDIIKTPINWIIEGVNKVIDALNSLSIDVPDWVPGIGGQTWGFNIAHIPMLAEGGIVHQPTLAMIGEGSSSEAVVPLDGRLEEIIAKAVATTMAALGMNKDTEEKQTNITIPVYLGNKLIKTEIINDINRQTRINGKSVIINR